MNFSDRRLTCFAAGLMLLGSVSGCRSARYQTAGNPSETTTYGGTAVSPQSVPVREPPSAFGPREPIPMDPADEPVGRSTVEPVPEDVPAARSFDLGPALQATPDDSPVDEDLRFPEANRRTKQNRSLRGLLSAARQKSSGAPRKSEESTTLTTARPAQDRATAKLVQHSAAPARPVVETEPVLVSDPPTLLAPPAARPATRAIEPLELQIERLALCSEVRDFDDLVQVDPQRLTRQSPFLVYAALQNFRSHASHGGFQTLTRAQIELRTVGGEVVWRQALGNTTDVAARPRHHYFVAHQVSIPGHVAPGNYLLSLRVDDILSEQSASKQVAVRIYGGS